jgi:hypothetical protein
MRCKVIQLGYRAAPVSGYVEPKRVLPVRRVRGLLSEVQLRVVALMIWSLIALVAFVLAK